VPKGTILEAVSPLEQTTANRGRLSLGLVLHCEHVFVSVRAPYARFKRSLEIGKLPLVLAAAADLPPLNLEDALDVLMLMAEQSPPERYGGAAARWCGRLAAERVASLAELRLAVAACELLPSHPAGVRVLRALLETRETAG
jgi:hypothetical protein